MRTRRERERERSGRDFGIVTIVESRCVMRGGVSILLYLGEERDPSWMSYKCHTSKRNIQSQGRVTFRVLVVS
jgi:hypothetical protein